MFSDLGFSLRETKKTLYALEVFRFAIRVKLYRMQSEACLIMDHASYSMCQFSLHHEVVEHPLVVSFEV